jgi:hypothetical protein
MRPGGLTGRIELSGGYVRAAAASAHKDLDSARQIDGPRVLTFAHTSPWSGSASRPARLWTYLKLNVIFGRRRPGDSRETIREALFRLQN